MIYLPDFVLKEYQPDLLVYQHIVKLLEQDKEIADYIGSITGGIYGSPTCDIDKLYIVSYQGMLLGFISIGKNQTHVLKIRYGLLKVNRGQQPRFGQLLLQQFSDYILSHHRNIEGLVLYIEPSNYASVKTAINCQFERENFLVYQKKRKKYF